MYKNGFSVINVNDVSYIVEFRENIMSGNLGVPTQMFYEANQIYKFEIGKGGALCFKHRDEHDRLNKWCFDIRIENQLLDRIVLTNSLGVGVPLYKIYNRARKNIGGFGPIHYGVEIQKKILFPAAAVEQIYAIGMSHFHKQKLDFIF